MSNCVQCPNDPVPACSCDANEQCIRINQSCDECAHNICQAIDGSSGGPSAGATAGGAVGGAAAGIALVTLLWFLYRKRTGSSFSTSALFGQRLRLKHSRSQSRHLGAQEKGSDEEGEEMSSRPASRAIDNRMSHLSRRVSIHKDADDQPTGSPFADPANGVVRSSVVRNSSQIAPISSFAYLPPDANSMSLEEGHQRTALGEKRRNTALGVIPANQAVENKSARKGSVKSKAKPIPLRPSRDPHLDLVLPTPSPRSPATPVTPTSGPPVVNLQNPDSRFSSSTWATGYTGLRESSTVGSESGRARPPSALSARSAVSSHPSVLVDPPQLVTLSASAERVEMATARAVVLHKSPKRSKAQSTGTLADPFGDAASEDPLQLPFASALHVSDAPSRPGSTISVPESSRQSLAPQDDVSVRTPSQASFSGLDGIPFVSSSTTAERSSGLVAGDLLAARGSIAEQSRPTSAASFATSASAWARSPTSVLLEAAPPLPGNQGLSAASWSPALRPESALSAPADVTRRSGFSSGGALADVPFQLAFPGERNSVARTERISTFSEMPELATARSSFVTVTGDLTSVELEDPFADTPPSVPGDRGSKATLPGDRQNILSNTPVVSMVGTRHSVAASERASLASLADLVAEIDTLEG